jgi:hypothetical protein
MIKIHGTGASFYTTYCENYLQFVVFFIFIHTRNTLENLLNIITISAMIALIMHFYFITHYERDSRKSLLFLLNILDNSPIFSKLINRTNDLYKYKYEFYIYNISIDLTQLYRDIYLYFSI